MTQDHGHTSGSADHPREPDLGQPATGPAPAPPSGQTPWAAPGQRDPSPGPTWVPPGHSDGGPPVSGPPTAGPPAYGAQHPHPAATTRPGLIALRPLNMSEILNGAFNYIRRNAKTVLGLSFIVIAISSLVSAVGLGGYFADYGAWLGEILNDPAAADVDTLPVAPWSLVTMYGGVLFSYIGDIVLTGLLAAVIGLAVLGTRLTMREAVRAVRSRMAAVFGVAGLLFLLMLGFTALVAAAIGGALAVGYLLGVIFGVVVGVIGLAGAVVLGVWVWVRTSMAMPITVLERVGPARALVRSWRLTQRSWWRVFGLLLLAMFIASVVANLVTTPFAFAGMLLPLLSPGAFWVYVATTAISLVATVLTGVLSSPFVVGVTSLLYVDLRMRREGLDLKLQAAAQSGETVGPEIYLPDSPDTPRPSGAPHDHPAAGTRV